MSLTVVLAVGLDSRLLATQSTLRRNEGFVVMNAGSIQEAIEHFKAGDFDLVLLEDSISLDNKERLAFLVRASGSQTPVISVSDICSDIAAFGGAVRKNDAGALLNGITELITARAKAEQPPAILLSNAR
jgi:DNA-binding NtrC family response regulator